MPRWGRPAPRGRRIPRPQCGKMDQACAFGCTPVLMTYDGDVLSVAGAAVAAPLHLVLVDLAASKDTVAILEGLQASAAPRGGAARIGVSFRHFVCVRGQTALKGREGPAGKKRAARLAAAPAPVATHGCARSASGMGPTGQSRAPASPLQSAFPHPTTAEQRACVELLGPINADVTSRALAMMAAGEVEQVGAAAPAAVCGGLVPAGHTQGAPPGPWRMFSPLLQVAGTRLSGELPEQHCM